MKKITKNNKKHIEHNWLLNGQRNVLYSYCVGGSMLNIHV